MGSSSPGRGRTLVQVNQGNFEIPGLRVPTSTLRGAMRGEPLGPFFALVLLGILPVVPVLWAMLFSALGVLPVDRGSQTGLSAFLVYSSGIVVAFVVFLAFTRWDESRPVNQGKVHIVIRNPAGRWGKRVVRVSATDAPRPLDQVFAGVRKGVVVISGLSAVEVESVLDTLSPYVPD